MLPAKLQILCIVLGLIGVGLMCAALRASSDAAIHMNWQDGALAALYALAAVGCGYAIHKIHELIPEEEP